MVIFQQTDSDGFPHFRRDSSMFEPSRSRDADFLEEDWTGGCPQSSFLDDCRDHPRSRLAQVSRDSHVPTGYGLALSPVGKASLYPPVFPTIPASKMLGNGHDNSCSSRFLSLPLCVLQKRFISAGTVSRNDEGAAVPRNFQRKKPF